MTFRVPERDRFTMPGNPFSSTVEDGNNGLFFVSYKSAILKCIASDGAGWEHVSVSLPHRCPNWSEMCHVKKVFWDPDDVVMQLHPPESQYVNHHPFCLHLWRPIGVDIPLPPSFLVGPRSEA